MLTHDPGTAPASTHSDDGCPPAELSTLRRALADKDAIIAQRDQELDSLRRQNVELNRILTARDAGIDFLRLELARLEREPMRQREWWDKQFAHSWEHNSGPAQSRHFMQRLITNLMPREVNFISSRRLRILDWGCATGDGLKELSKAFPICDSVGIDISKVAIEKAQAKFPNLTFIATERGDFQERFDVIFTSNCLEHFDAPLEWLEGLLQKSRWLVIVMVPYKELNRIADHKVTFCEDSFPEMFRGFTRLQASAIQVDPAFWAGEQLLVVYSSREYVQQIQQANASA